MQNKGRNFWGYRIDKNNIEYFKNQLFENEILIQGWGYDAEQDLRNLKYDGGALRNMPMFNNVKKGDILLVPRLPDWDSVAIVEALEDWNIGYDYQIDSKLNDYGHKFPARFIKSFNRHNKAVSGNIRSTLKTPSRFWNINSYEDDIKNVIEADTQELSGYEEYNSRLNSSVRKIFTSNLNDSSFKDDLHAEISKQLNASEWEFVLEYGLKKLFPYYEINKTGGVLEAKHGSDIIIKLPSVFDSGKSYVIAVQIKDWYGNASEDELKKAISQVGKADSFYKDNESVQVIDKVIILTNIISDDPILAKYKLNEEKVRFVFADEFKDLLKNISKKIIIEQIEKD